MLTVEQTLRTMLGDGLFECDLLVKRTKKVGNMFCEVMHHTYVKG